MQRNRTWKLATGLMALMLLATPLLAFVPSEISADTGNTLSINVFDENGPVIGATASLTEVRNVATAYPGTSNDAGLLLFTPTPGYYQLKVSASGHYDIIYDNIIRFDGLSNKYLGIMTMDLEDPADCAVFFNVTSGGTAIEGASVVVKYDTHDNLADMQTMDSGSTNATGVVELSLNATDYYAVVKKTNYVTKVVPFTAANNTTVNVALSTSVSYSGTVTVNGAAASNVKVYLVDQNDPRSAPDAKILTPAVKSSNYFKFDAYPGDFYLVVDADNALGIVSDVPISTAKTVPVNLESQNQRNEENAFVLAADDWNYAVMTKTLDLDHDYTVPGLDYAYLPSIRMQIDLALGDGDGEVSATEMTAFEAVMASYGPLDVTTEGMMTVSAKTYVSEDADPICSITGLDDAVDSNTGFQMQMVANYAASGITNALSSYQVKVTTPANTSKECTYKLAFPNGTDRYEMVQNVTTSTTIDVSGYTEAVVMAGSVAGTATLTVQKSVAPTAAAAIVTGVDAYKVMNGSTFLHYVVAQDVNVTLAASGSSDPNGNPLTYTWDFGDGNDATVTTVTTIHVYASSEQFTVNLTVTDVAGLTAYEDFLVKVDGMDPVVVITHNDSVVGTTLQVDQNEAMTFTSTDSYDRLNASDEEGLIASYRWDWGDGNSTTVLMGENQTVSHTWTMSGTFNMYLNLTDVANHTSSKAVTVNVKDTVPPTVKFSVLLNGTIVTSAKENQTLDFNASASSDISGIANYTWDFGDGELGYGQCVNHTYQAIKTYTVKLTLTDNEGNTANKTMSLKIESQPRPDIRVGSVTFEPDRFTEGESGYVYVNVTNVGDLRAEGLYVQLYRVDLDGSKTLLTDVGVLLVNDTQATYLNVGESGVIRIEQSFGSKGDYTLQVKVTANNEVSSKMSDNTATVSLEVQEASWKAWLLYGGIFAVIIVVIVLFMFRKRLPMMPSKKPATPPSKKK